MRWCWRLACCCGGVNRLLAVLPVLARAALIAEGFGIRHSLSVWTTTAEIRVIRLLPSCQARRQKLDFQQIVVEDQEPICSCVSTRTPTPVADARAKLPEPASDAAAPPPLQDMPPFPLLKNLPQWEKPYRISALRHVLCHLHSSSHAIHLVPQ